jgi:hypothetical protein
MIGNWKAGLLLAAVPLGVYAYDYALTTSPSYGVTSTPDTLWSQFCNLINACGVGETALIIIAAILFLVGYILF